MANFRAVIVAKEDKSVIDRVVDYYLGLGANGVTVFFDEEPGFTMNERGRRLDFIVCDAGFWTHLIGRRPEIFDERQVTLYEYAITQFSEEWIFFVDCDEYLISERPLTFILDEVPENIDIVRIRNVEAIWGPGDNRDAHLGARWFRRPTRSRKKLRLLKLIYGKEIDLMDEGLLGHSAGKQFVRSGRTYRELNAHSSFHEDGRPAQWIDDFTRTEIIVCHFDAMNFDRWRKKFLYRSQAKSAFPLMRKSRARLVDVIGSYAEGDDEPMRQLFERLYCISIWQAMALKALGLAFKRDIFEDQPRDEESGRGDRVA